MPRYKRKPPWAMLNFMVNMWRLIHTLICPGFCPWH